MGSLASPGSSPVPWGWCHQRGLLQLAPRLRRPLGAAVGGAGSSALWVPAPRPAAPGRTPLASGCFGSVSAAGSHGEVTARESSGDKGPTPALARLAGPRKEPAAAGPLPGGDRQEGKAAGRRAAGALPLQGAAGRRSGGRGRPGRARPVSAGPFSSPPASAEAPEGARWVGRGISPPRAGAAVAPLLPGRHGTGAGRCPPHLPAAEPQKGLKARGG